MSFTVEPGAVRAFAHVLGGLTDDADAAVGYTRQHLGIGYDKGRMFFTVVETATAIGISAAAAAATSWTVVGGVAGGIATAASIYEAVKVWYLVLDAHDAAWAAVQVFTGLCAGYLGAVHGMEHHPLPGAAYQHPGV